LRYFALFRISLNHPLLRNIYILAISIFLPLCSLAQLFTISGTIKDGKGQPMPNVNIQIRENSSITALTDEQGSFVIDNLPKGTYQLRFSHIGYQPILRTFRLDQNRETNIIFSQQELNIDEVYVTARESNNISTSSIITRDAMQHLQPSSFTDILELLPGGRTASPRLNQVNGINLRSVDGSMSGYNTSSLGTMFSIDGMQLNSQSMIDPTAGFGLGQGTMNNGRITSNIGVDMRTIATDNIEKVEVIRGIPSVEHGNLTSGVVLIERIKGYEPWSARIKTDGFSKLFSIGKGLDLKDYKLNFDAGYLISNQNVTDIFNNFKRLNSSIRGEKTWKLPNYRFTWNHNIDFNTTIDNERLDPDNDYKQTDSYNNSIRRLGLGNTFKLFSSNPKQVFRNASFSLNVNYSSNQIDIERLVQPNSISILMNSLEAGSRETGFLQSSYIGKMKTDSRPLDIQLKMLSNWSFNALIKHQVKAGIEYSYAKNLGNGQQYDLDFPIATSISARPRAFNDIPAISSLSAFAEDRFFINLGEVLFENNLGVRAFAQTNLDSRYSIAGKVYAEPRYNGKLHLPRTILFGKTLKSNIFGGIGLQTLIPNQNLLYPQLYYNDIPELIYYHNNPEYRIAWANTFITDQTNFDLRPAKNKKWEIGAQFDLGGNTFSINYFNEAMSNGFRSVTQYNAIPLRKYDVNSIDPTAITSKPDITDFSYEDQAEYHSYTKNENGSSTEKSGIEYQFSSKRIPGLNTRFTINGAWFKTSNRNIQPVFEAISQNVVTDGKVRQYIALYKNGNTGGTYESLNTNVTADSYLPTLGINLSLSVQNVWYKSSQRLFRDDLPIGYYDIEQNYHAYTEADRNDPNLRYFDLKNDPFLYNKFTAPIDLLVNFKATKVIKDKIRIAMFVNRLFIYKPNYTQYGVYNIRRNDPSDNPYFGMEINIKI